MSDEFQGRPDARTTWSSHPATAWAIIAVVVPVGGWLLWEIHRTIGLDAPRFWELLRTDRVFDVAMLDFFVTAGWAGLVWAERIDRRDWRAWAAFALFCVIPSLGIAALILATRRRGAAVLPPPDPAPTVGEEFGDQPRG